MLKQKYKVTVCREYSFFLTEDEYSVARLLMIRCGEGCNMSHRAEIVKKQDKPKGER